RKGNIVKDTDASNQSTITERDKSSRPVKITYPDTAVAEYEYDSFGNLTKYVPKGRSSATGATLMQYDANNNLIFYQTPDDDGFDLAYDAKSNLLSITDAYNAVTSFTYSPEGLLTTRRDGEGRVTTYSYDSDGLLASITDGLNNMTSLSYDAAGNVTSITDGNGNVTTLTYDVNNRLTSSTDAKGHRITYNHKPSCGCSKDNMISTLTDPNNNTWQFEYDAVGNLLKRVDPMGGIEAFTYNNDRQITKRTLKDGRAINYQYDNLGRLFKVAYPDDTVSYSYDINGNLTKVSDNSGSVTYIYDNANRVTSEMVAISGYPTKRVDFGYTWSGYSISGDLITKRYVKYDDAGRPDAPRTSTSITYDKSGRIKSLTNYGGYDNYHYDAAGRLTRIDPTIGKDIDYTYDKVGNVLTETIDTTTSIFGYDPTYQLLSGTNPTEAYTYDKLGNRLAGPAAETYTYDSNNKLIGGSGAYTYDANGNMTSKTPGGTTITYQWNAKGQLTQAKKGTTTVDYVYDAIGRRVLKIIDNNGTVTKRRYIDIGWNVAEIRDKNDAEVLQVFHGPNIDQIMYVVKGSDKYRYWTDRLGNVKALLEPYGGTPGYKYDYDVFGNPMITTVGSPTVENPFMFNGREWDSEVGIYYYRARYYDPSIGRFISEDPINLAGGINLYNYVGGNPVNRVDPWGLILWYADTASETVMKPHIQQIMRTPTGRRLLNQLHSDPQTYLIHSGFDAQGRTNGQLGNHVYVNPNSTNIQMHTDCGTKTASTTRILAHELGHLTGTADDGPNRINNVNTWENPIMQPLEGYNRTRYQY
ncbi:MAG: RHS repeat-associated core domain-containing protein, partial [Pseudomonadota bacterium]